MSFNRVILDLGSSTNASVRFSSPLSFVAQLHVTGYYVDTPSADKLRIEIQASGLDTLDCAVASTVAPGGGTALYEAFTPDAGTGKQRLELLSPVPLLAKPVNTQLASVKVMVTDWAGAPVTYTSLVVFCAITAYDPTQDPTGFRRVMHSSIAKQAWNEF